MSVSSQRWQTCRSSTSSILIRSMGHVFCSKSCRWLTLEQLSRICPSSRRPTLFYYLSNTRWNIPNDRHTSLNEVNTHVSYNRRSIRHWWCERNLFVSIRCAHYRWDTTHSYNCHWQHLLIERECRLKQTTRQWSMKQMTKCIGHTVVIGLLCWPFEKSDDRWIEKNSMNIAFDIAPTQNRIVRIVRCRPGFNRTITLIVRRLIILTSSRCRTASLGYQRYDRLYLILISMSYHR
jgi:hypothetical protein